MLASLVIHVVAFRPLPASRIRHVTFAGPSDSHFEEELLVEAAWVLVLSKTPLALMKDSLLLQLLALWQVRLHLLQFLACMLVCVLVPDSSSCFGRSAAPAACGWLSSSSSELQGSEHSACMLSSRYGRVQAASGIFERLL